MVSSFAINQLKTDSVVDMDPVDVYCDVVEPCVVGDSQVPLLRIMLVEGDHGQLVTWIYENVHIRDRTENVKPFEQGTLNVTLHFTLHFRQCKHLSTL